MIIGIDSSRMKGEFTILEEEMKKRIIPEYTEDIPFILKEKNVNVRDIEAIGVSIGPGSFTGLRIGLAISKGLSFDNTIKVYGIKTFDGMVVNMDNGLYIPLLYAKTGFVYSSQINKSGEKINRLKEDGVYNVEDVKKWEGRLIGDRIKGFEDEKIITDFSLSEGIVKIVQLIIQKKYHDYVLNPVEPMYFSLSEAELKRLSFDFEYSDIEKKDLSEIMEIERESFIEPWDLISFKFILSSKKCYAKKAKNGDVLLGYSIGCFEEDAFHLMNLAVRKNSRRKGIGKNILYRTIKDVEREGVKKVFLEVRITNEPAINLYKKMGFKIKKIQKGYYQKGVDAIIMELGIFV